MVVYESPSPPPMSPSPPPAPPPRPAGVLTTSMAFNNDNGSGDDDGLLVPLVMGIAAGTVVVLILAMGFAYYFAWRRAEVRPSLALTSPTGIDAASHCIATVS